MAQGGMSTSSYQSGGFMKSPAPPFSLAKCHFPCMPLVADSLNLLVMTNLFFRVLKKLENQECSLPSNSRQLSFWVTLQAISK